MVVGSGDIASVLPERDNFLFFAAGVSNSQQTDEQEYYREEALLNRQDRSKHLVYFSSLSVFSSDTRYTQHKRYMEHLVKKNFRHHTILRIGNITWGTNPLTLINYLRQCYEEGTDIEIQDVYRYIVDKEEFLYWIDLIPEWSCEMNVPGRRLKVQEVIDEYVIVHT